jgi:vesicular inhibitory amino acid transporter
MFVVSLPYAVLHGGYWALIALMGVAHICCYTGRILVDCLYEENAEGQLVRVRNSYASIAMVCFGERFGGKLVSTAQVIELLMTCILYVAMCGDLMHFSFEFVVVDIRSWMMICGIVLLPCAFLRDLHAVSTLSFW